MAIVFIVSWLFRWMTQAGSKGRWLFGAVQQLSVELGELLQWPCYNGSTINTGLVVVVVVAAVVVTICHRFLILIFLMKPILTDSVLYVFPRFAARICGVRQCCCCICCKKCKFSTAIWLIIITMFVVVKGIVPFVTYICYATCNDRLLEVTVATRDS